MGFFDDIGKKISQGSQDVAKKAKDFAETSKLNSKIADEEKNILNNYVEIGKKFYEENKETPNPDYLPFFENIQGCNARIEEYKDEIIKIKNIKICPNCGAECDAGAPFCAACGTKLETVVVEGTATEQQPQNQIPASVAHCSNCGAELAPGAVFCAGCGNKVG